MSEAKQKRKRGGIQMVRMIVSFLIWAFALTNSTPVDSSVTVVPPMPGYAPMIGTEEYEWSEFWAESWFEYVHEFTALFDSYETKRAKNGALMIRQGSEGSFKFAKKG